MALTLYKRIAYILLPSCRHLPSCSSYAEAAVRRHGALAGMKLTAKRLARCRPFSPGGWDPVP